MRIEWIRKLIALPLLAPFLFSLSSCNTWLLGDQKTLVESMMNEFVEALNSRDKEGIKSKFQKIVIDTIEDFDSQINELLEYVNVEIASHKMTSTGMEGETLGYSGTNQRYFDGVDYRFEGEDGSIFKLDLNYRYYYSYDDFVDEDRIGLFSLDIINAADDWGDAGEYYGGCPYDYNGINIGYKTSFGFEGSEYNIALYNNGGEFDPFIANNAAKLNYFYENNKDLYDLDKKENGRGYMDYIEIYNDESFNNSSVLVCSFYHEEAGRTYTPQSVYIDDTLVVLFMAAFNADEEISPEENKYKGAIFLITLPKKVNDQIKLDIPLKFVDY